MDEHQEHSGHSEHWHDSACGHETTQSGGHTDYVHDGHKHHEHDGHWDEHPTPAGTEATEPENPWESKPF